jgi:hypothetical protein
VAILSAALVAQTRPAPASKPTTTASAPKDALAGAYWSGLLRELKLTETHLASLRQKVQDKIDALAAFDDSDDGKTLATLGQQRQQAQQGGEDDKVKRLREQIKPLRLRRTAIEQQKEAEVMAIFSPAHLGIVREYDLYIDLCGYFAKAKLSASQRKDLREIVRAAGAELAGTDPKDAAAAQKLRDKLIAGAREQIKWEPRQILALEARKIEHPPEPTSAPADDEGGK